MTTTSHPVPKIDPNTPPRPFSEVITETGEGVAHDDAGHLLRQLVAAVTATRKPGTVTLTVKVEAPPQGRFLVVTAEAKAKIPEPDAEASFWFVDPKGNLTRHDPGQMSLSIDVPQT